MWHVWKSSTHKDVYLLVIPSAMGQHMYSAKTLKKKKKNQENLNIFYILESTEFSSVHFWECLNSFITHRGERKRHSHQLIKYNYWTVPTENNIFVRTSYLSGTEPTQSNVDTIAPNLAWMILKGNIWTYQILCQGLTIFFDLFDTFNQKHRTY